MIILLMKIITKKRKTEDKRSLSGEMCGIYLGCLTIFRASIQEILRGYGQSEAE